MVDFSVEITLSPPGTTLDKLKDQNRALYVFQAVQFGQTPTIAVPGGGLFPAPLSDIPPGFGGGYPLVWLKDTGYNDTIRISWPDNMKAYITADESVSQGSIITIGRSIDVAIGQTVEVDKNGEMTTRNLGLKGVVQVYNIGTTPRVCGLARTVKNKDAPTCAFPLGGMNQIMIGPANKVLVMFATCVSKVGQAVSIAWNHGLLVTADSDSPRTVKYDFDLGWSADHNTWAEAVNANQKLDPLLIIPSRNTR
jgi:hypothetical protein